MPLLVPKPTMEDESPSNMVLVNAEDESLVKPVKLAIQNQIQESLDVPPTNDSSTPLLIGSPAGDDGDPEAQQTTVLSEAKLPPWTWQERVQVVVIIILFLSAFGLSPALQASGADPLSFSRLSWYSTSISIGIALFIVVRRHHVLFKPRPSLYHTRPD
jgi:hypothetical protein